MQSLSNQAHKTSSLDSAARRPARRKRSTSPGDPASSGFIEALARGLEVLRCFSPDTRSLGNLELAERTGLPKSTISRIVYTLSSLGYLRYDQETGRYSPDYGILALGFGCLASLEVRQLARPLMEMLAESTGAAVALGAFDGQAMTYVDALHGSAALYLRLPVGYRVSMDSTMGRTYLASLNAHEREALLPKLETPAHMSDTLLRAQKDYENSGCCYGLGDWQAGINAVAAPFTAITGEGTFVISCGGPESILSEQRLRTEISAQLNDIVQKLSLPAIKR